MRKLLWGGAELHKGGGAPLRSACQVQLGAMLQSMRVREGGRGRVVGELSAEEVESGAEERGGGAPTDGMVSYGGVEAEAGGSRLAGERLTVSLTRRRNVKETRRRPHR